MKVTVGNEPAPIELIVTNATIVRSPNAIRP